MLLKEYCRNWPPPIRIDNGNTPPKVKLDDVVAAVKVGTQGALGLIIRRSYGTEYTLPIVVPHSLQQKLLFDILRKKKITLREVGALPIA